MSFINQGDVSRVGGGNPRTSVLDAVRILGDRDNLEILIFELLINCLPAWQV